MTMIPGCGATIFSSPPLCRARGLSFFFPLCSVLFLFSLSGFAGVGNANGASLYFSVFLFLSILCLFFYLLDDDGAVGGDWEERWRRWWRLCGPQPVVEERFTIPCTSTGHGGRGMGLLPFVMVGRHGSPVFSINEGMGCVSS
ncbi:hypothetical protein POTOM_053371 [Populus tomentosa]|uniref:Uncharacterized protein n=1 Tax=Populus tomentosa TaxID=118781 RepID=A0A8X7Y1T7_POPTO|nr:hypothetical protein POTOM_053371 [Populus tomentosa]